MYHHAHANIKSIQQQLDATCNDLWPEAHLQGHVGVDMRWLTYEQRIYTMQTQWVRFGERKLAILSLHCVRKQL